MLSVYFSHRSSPNVHGHGGLSSRWASRGSGSFLLLALPSPACGFKAAVLWQECEARGGSPGEVLMVGARSSIGHFCSHSITWNLVMWGHIAARKCSGGRSHASGGQLACLCHTHQGLKLTSQLNVTGILATVLIWHCIEISLLRILAFWSLMKDR